jgi:putative transposase
MLVFEAKLRGTDEQYAILDEMIRTARFVRNSCLRYWMDNKGSIGTTSISIARYSENNLNGAKTFSASLSG